ncbi:MFS general substrate transporter [Aspergillus steynii IBT 23096]|uniref:MFS general substrate transporter n=1 Tax=Aspergillus steynii IBT 23096 TaxID=1392250 RepID=A0A2I2G432_9EURO|nr:MFS general substrate transporter [Aspergillus steynii IBT 23096]PLB47640.1 MFS general substrate transporter [Aspergillus steynii IBT 23096]
MTTNIIHPFLAGPSIELPVPQPCQNPASSDGEIISLNESQLALKSHNEASQPAQTQPAPAEEPPTAHKSQSKPPELPTLFAEIIFIIVCSMGQLLFAILLSNTLVNQVTLVEALGISGSLSPWLVGSFLLANGISVVISGSLADLTNPKWLTVGAFIWLTIWDLIGVFSIQPSRMVLYFFARAMQGIAVGVLESTAMSILGRVYKPGQRKNKVFAMMSAMIPMGFGIGALQGGAFSAHLHWVFGSTAILCAICAAAAYWVVPSIPPSTREQGSDQLLSIKDFDFLGAAVCACGCGLLIFGLTQGAPTNWTPYTYALVIVGALFFVAFYFVEQWVTRPLIDNRVWRTPGFIGLMVSYFLGYGAFVGAWMFYAVRFFLTIQSKPPILAAVYLLPIAVAGTLATWVVAKTLHILPGHYILITSMISFTMGPVFFLPQTANTTYWALSFPGIILATFGPDMSFAAASIFITSNVPRSFQGAAGSLLITMQNLSSAVFTAVGDTIGENVTKSGGYALDLEALRAIWWFSLAAALLGAVICAVFVRIPKSEEKEHVQ